MFVFCSSYKSRTNKSLHAHIEITHTNINDIQITYTNTHTHIDHKQITYTAGKEEEAAGGSISTNKKTAQRCEKKLYFGPEKRTLYELPLQPLVEIIRLDLPWLL